MRGSLPGESRVRIASSDGFDLAAWIAAPDDPHGLVVLCHGLATGADDDGPFLPLRDALLARRIATARFDARCHGETGGSWRELSLRGWRNDILAVASQARRELPEIPIALLAASFSAGPATRAANSIPDLAGVAYWNPVLDYEATFLDERFECAREVLASAGDPTNPGWAQLRVPWADVPLSSGLVEELRSDRTERELAALRCPALVVHGTSDWFVPLETNLQAVDQADQARLLPIPLARHGFRFFRPLVRQITVRWLTRELAKLRDRPGTPVRPA